MKAVYKYEITGNEIEIPKEAKFLFAGEQHGQAFAWFEVDPDSETEKRTIHIVGTGMRFKNMKHLWSYQAPPFIWHVYEEI